MTQEGFGHLVIFLLGLQLPKMFIQLRPLRGVSSSLQLGAAGGSLGKLSERDLKTIEYGLALMEMGFLE